MSSTQSHNQAAGPQRPRRRILSKILEQIPGHIEVEAISINGQTDRVCVEATHEDMAAA